MILGITGHRKINDKYYDKNDPDWINIEQRIYFKLKILVPSVLITGMALGVDQMAAKICLTLNIPFIAAVPFVGQEDRWNDASKIEYKELLMEAQEVKIISPGGYAGWKMQTRNKWIVDNCENLLAVYDGGGGGTRNCVEYAKNLNKKIWVINPNEGDGFFKSEKL